MKPISFSAGEVQKLDDILYIRYSKDSEITEADMMEITKLRRKLFGANKYVSLIDLREDNLVLTPAAKKYVSENAEIKSLRIAEVLLVKNFAQKIGVSIYARLFRSKDLISVMTEESKAKEWLKAKFNLHQAVEA